MGMGWLKAALGAGVGAAWMKRRQQQQTPTPPSADGDVIDMRLKPGRDLQLEVVLAPHRQVVDGQPVWMFHDPEHGGNIRLDDEQGDLVGWISPRQAAFATNLIDASFETVAREITALRQRRPRFLVRLSVDSPAGATPPVIGLEIPVVVDNPHA
jgi:hypothetical protein